MCKYLCSLIFAQSLQFLVEPRKRRLRTAAHIYLILSLLCLYSSHMADQRLILWCFLFVFVQRLDFYAFSLSSMHIIRKPRASFFEFMCSVKVYLHSGYSPRSFPILIYLGFLKIKDFDRPRMFLVLEGFTV